MSKVVPCMWFNGDAEEAAKFYVSLVPNSAITNVQRNVSDGPSGKEAPCSSSSSRWPGQPLVALNGGMKMEYTHAISLMIHCDDQAQVDSVWNAFLAHGGKEEQCGWLRDRWGVAWQVVPKVMFEFLVEPRQGGCRTRDAGHDEDGEAGRGGRCAARSRASRRREARELAPTRCHRRGLDRAIQYQEHAS